jgi:hypothetical protein
MIIVNKDEKERIKILLDDIQWDLENEDLDDDCWDWLTHIYDFLEDMILD